MRILALTARKRPRAKPAIAKPPRLVVNNYPLVISLIEFAAGALKRQSGAAIEFEDFYLAYREHCTAKSARALAPAEAVAQTNELCRECGITIQRKGRKRFLADVSGVSALHECKRSHEGRTMTETDMASVHKFAAHALRHHLGAETTFAAFWDAYRRHCETQNLAVLNEKDTAKALLMLTDVIVGVQSSRCVTLLDVELKQSA